MKFYSTRNHENIVNFKEAVFKGLASDGGLFHPIKIESFKTAFDSMDENTSFKEIAKTMTELLFSDELNSEAAQRIAEKAFPFEPKIKHTKEDIDILELFHGPSCAFKDFGASYLATVMEEFLENEHKHAVILTATSGDTGSAVARAFHNKKNIDVVILYPSGRVSPLQEKQLTTLGGNVKALEVKGNFDDCQRMVKEAFVNEKLNSQLTLTSANSINLGRLIPQSFYYIWAYNKLKKQNKDIYFCVPSGNFGNITAGILALKWGLDIKGFLAATNSNDVIPEYLKSGSFNPRASMKTYSNAMDVGDPSNFERLLEMFDHDYKKMANTINYEVVNDKETIETMKNYYAEENDFIDPHTAVGFLASKRFKEKNNLKDSKIITLSTAHPGKFLEVVEEATGLTPELPGRLKELIKLEKKSTIINNKLEELSEFLLNNFK